MNEDVLNMEIRKFLKRVGVTSQREIEMAVRAGIESGKLKGRKAVSARMTLVIEPLDLSTRSPRTSPSNRMRAATATAVTASNAAGERKSSCRPLTTAGPSWLRPDVIVIDGAAVRAGLRRARPLNSIS